MGNGTLGLLVWGDETLCVTISRAGFWDRRNGKRFSAETTYREVKRLVDARDENGLHQLFAKNVAQKPFQLGGGRLEISSGNGYRPKRALLHLSEGLIEIELGNSNGEVHSIRIGLSMSDELAWIEGLDSAAFDPIQIKLYAAWDFLEKSLRELGIPEPKRHSESAGEAILQSMPADEPLAFGWRRQQGTLLLETALGSAAATFSERAPRFSDLADAKTIAGQWWREYWKSVPQLNLPDAELQHAYLLGLHKQAGLTTPGGVAATLQGPWMEEDHIPPWSNDYHFNINVQLVYGPAFPTNRLAHFQPLWDLIREWLPTLRQNGENFFERPGAMMLPHAVDDRCQVIGSFWTGTIDHACTAWMAQMAWQHYRYSLDENILRELAWPLLVGAFEGYWAMLERMEKADGSWRFSIPLSVSPEYNASSLSACGRDASFQLAAFHCIAQILPQAAALLGQSIDARWDEVERHLPPYTEVAKPPRIGLWEAQDLDESHRHHAHLASIWPFATLDPAAPEHWEIVGRTMRHWGVMGAGRWTGWCLPWSSILCTRCGLPDAAVSWLKWMLQAFTNVGHGTLHDSDFGGVGGSWSDGVLNHKGFQREENFHEVMQMDAAMALVTAILELLVQSRGDTIHVLERLPKRWRDFSFAGIRTEGAFFVGGEAVSGKVKRISVRSEKGGRLRLRHSMDARTKLHRGDSIEKITGGLLEVSLAAGEELRLVAAD